MTGVIMHKSTHTPEETRGMYTEEGLERHNKGKFDEGVRDALEARDDNEFEAFFNESVAEAEAEKQGKPVEIDFRDIQRTAQAEEEAAHLARCKVQCEQESRIFRAQSSSGGNDGFY